jgi:hypothetical protein
VGGEQGRKREKKKEKKRREGRKIAERDRGEGVVEGSNWARKGMCSVDGQGKHRHTALLNCLFYSIAPLLAQCPFPCLVDARLKYLSALYSMDSRQ